MVRCASPLIDADLVRVLGMVLDELLTNAAKYGALWTPEGRVSILSSLDRSCRPPRLHVEWLEQAGPGVRAPTRRAFGVHLIEEALAYEAEGIVRVDFPDSGLRCTLELPMERYEG